MTVRITRRACLLALLAAPAQLLASRVGGARDGANALGQDPVADLLSLLPRESAAAIGRQYLREHHDPAVEAELARALLPEARLGYVPWRAQLKRRLGATVRADFRNGRTVRVSNWHLSVTEARLCALAALSNPA